jgi:hypothetical protein
MPTTAQMAMEDAANTGAASRCPLARVRRNTAGIALGSIIAAIIDIHEAAKKPNEPSLVAAPTGSLHHRELLTECFHPSCRA